MTGIAIGFRANGLKEAQELVARVEDGCKTWQRSRVGAGTSIPYGHWIEKGFYFGGRPGSTRAVRFMERAAADILPLVGPRIAKALPGGGPAVSGEAQKLSDELAAKAQEYATVRGGGLRGSIRANRGQSLRSLA